MEELNWKCDGECKEQLGQHSYAMIVSNVQVLEVNKEGRATASQSTGQQDEQLCYSCFTKKYTDPAEKLDAIMRLMDQFRPNLPPDFKQGVSEVTE